MFGSFYECVVTISLTKSETANSAYTRRYLIMHLHLYCMALFKVVVIIRWFNWWDKRISRRRVFSDSMYLKPDYDLEIFSYILSKDKSHYLPCIQYLKDVGLIVGLLLYIKK